MHYFGIPTCPYCKKRVNLIRVWSLKKHGEFMCPRCKGISNIYLSPLVYVFAILAIAAGFLIYFFHKFILDTVSLKTPLLVLIPFVLFFLLSLFFVYLKEPIIKKVRRTPDGRFFDEDGNEMKMRMGKLVKVSTGSPTGRAADRAQDAGNFYSGDDNFDAPQQYARVNPPAQRAQQPESPAPVHITDEDLMDDEELYAQAARKIQAENPDRDYTIGIDKKELQANAAPLEFTQDLDFGRARKLSEGQNLEEAQEIEAEVVIKEKKQHLPRKNPADEGFPDPIPVGKVAQERVEGSSAPNSGFEDLFDMYSTKREKTSRPRTAAQQNRPRPATRQTRQPERRESGRTDKAQSGRNSSRGGSRFRDL